jgi:hypothetical protein
MQGDAHPHEHKWLEWVGLEEPPEDPDAWEPVASDLAVENPESRSSEAASQIVAALGAGGIRAHQRIYVAPDQSSTGWYGLNFSGGPGPSSRIRAAVLVHHRDLEQATTLVAEGFTPEEISDAELTRQALEAGDELRREGRGGEIEP